MTDAPPPALPRPLAPGPRAARLFPLWLLLASPALAQSSGPGTPWAELAPMSRPPTPAKPQPAEPAPCQPANFIPGETPPQRVTREGSPSTFYRLPSGEEMNINGWNTEGERVVTLPSPYTLTAYTFGCASSLSHVLDITRGGKRHALYQHVHHFDWHPARRLFFFAQSERKAGGYQAFVGLVDLQSKKKIPLPPLDCVADGHARFSGDRLITYGAARAARDSKTAVCVWNLEGKLQARLLAELDWTAASTHVLRDTVGVLPNQPDVFYAVRHVRFEEPPRCRVRLQSLLRARASKQVDLGISVSEDACRAEAAAKLDTLRLDGP